MTFLMHFTHICPDPIHCGGVGGQEVKGWQGGNRSAVRVRSLHKTGKIKGKVGKPGNRQSSVTPHQTLGRSVQHHKFRGRLAPDQKGLAGRICQPLRWIPFIGEEEIVQLARRADFADEDRDSGCRMHELPGIQKPGRDVLCDFGATGAKDALAGGDKYIGQNQLHQHDQQPEIGHGAGKAKPGKAGGLHHHKFAFLHHAVHHIGRRRKSRDRKHQPDCVRQGQKREFQKDQCRLSIADQLVKQHHRPVHPIDGDQHKGKKPKQLHELRQEISVESGHVSAWPHNMLRRP